MKRFAPLVLPFYYYELEIDATTSEVTHRLAQNLQPSMFQGLATGEAILAGIIKGHRFFIKRPAGVYFPEGKLFAPVISGKIEEKQDMTKVSILMRVPLWVLIVFTLFYFVICLSGIIYILESPNGMPHQAESFWIDTIGLLFIPNMLNIWFWIEAFILEDVLNDILNT